MFMENRPTSRRPSRAWLVGLLLAALAVRLAWGLTRPADAASLAALPDQAEYLAVGRNLLAGRGLQFVDGRFNDVMRAYRTAGYPAFVALCGGNVVVVRIAQALLDASTVWAAVLLAGRWLRPGWAMIAGAVVAANPFLVYFTGLVLSETLFTAMLAWGMVLLVRSRGVVGWLAGGAVLAASVHVRPSAIGLAVVLGVLSVFVRPGLVVPRRRWPIGAGGTMVLVTVLVLLPWAIRNRLAVGAWVWTTTNGGVTLYDGLNPDADGSSDQSFLRDLPQLAAMDEVGRSAYLSGRAVAWASANPRRAVELAAVKVGRTWSPVPLSESFGRPLYVLVAATYAVPLFALTLVGVVAGPTGRAGACLLIAPAVYFTAVHAISVGSLRYRVPAEVPMAVVAAGGLQAVAGARRRVAAGTIDADGSD